MADEKVIRIEAQLDERGTEAPSSPLSSPPSPASPEPPSGLVSSVLSSFKSLFSPSPQEAPSPTVPQSPPGGSSLLGFLKGSKESLDLLSQEDRTVIQAFIAELKEFSEKLETSPEADDTRSGEGGISETLQGADDAIDKAQLIAGGGIGGTIFKVVTSALEGLVKAAGVAVGVFEALSSMVNNVIDDLAQVSPSLSMARGLQDLELMLKRMELGEQNSEKFMAYIETQTEFEKALLEFRVFWASTLTPVLQMMTELATTLTELVNTGQREVVKMLKEIIYGGITQLLDFLDTWVNDNQGTLDNIRRAVDLWYQREIEEEADRNRADNPFIQYYNEVIDFFSKEPQGPAMQPQSFSTSAHGSPLT